MNKKKKVLLIVAASIFLLLVLLVVGFFVLNSYIYNEKQVDSSEQSGTSQDENRAEGKMPVLKNLGVNIEAWDESTGFAGDLIFTKKLLFDDGNIKNTKVFAEFGELEHAIANADKSIEYWYFLKPGAKVFAAADGIIQISPIEHTKDFGINIVPEDGSRWFVGQEHIVNLVVKEGDKVKAGDILGEAMPHTAYGVDMSFTELSVGLGGSGIIKYCPFDFLEETQKPLYQEKLNRLVSDWEIFIGQDLYKQENWVSPGCLEKEIVER